MATQAGKGKVLRIGIILDGKIVQERLIKAGEAVTVGESAKSTFVFPKTHLPSGEYKLFEWTQKGYALRFTEEMKGKVSTGSNAVVALNKLAQDPSVTRVDSVFVLPLGEEDRGKLTIDAVTVLFQFVAPPLAGAVKPIQATDFRPRLLDEDDPIFLGFLGLWSAIAAVLAVYVYFTPPTEMTLDDLAKSQYQRLLIPTPVEEPPPIEAVADAPAPDSKADNNAKSQSTSQAKSSSSSEQRKSDIVESNRLLAKIIGTTGDSSSGLVENLYNNREQGLGDLDSALASATGAVTDSGSANFKAGAGGAGNGASDIGAIGSMNINGGASVDNVVAKAKVSSSSGQLEELQAGAEGVKQVVRRNQGQLKYCYEQQLKLDPKLSGRVEMGWSIAGGKVTNVYTVSNETGNESLAKCMITKIMRWTFTGDAEGDVIWPFVFTAGE